MFTIKLYRNNGWYQRIYSADDFSIIREFQDATIGRFMKHAEITLHRKSGDDMRVDIGASPYEPNGGVWEKCIIENAAGRTTEIIGQDVPPMADSVKPPLAEAA